MSQRSFVFCATCNPLGHRSVDHGERSLKQRGSFEQTHQVIRRESDSRSWYEGDLAAALVAGWSTDSQGQPVCRSCQERQLLLFDNPFVVAAQEEARVNVEFIFCDLCNPLAIRSLEQRRKTDRGDSMGRRFTDGRAWYEGDIWSAVLAGWFIGPEQKHYCPRCGNRHHELFEEAG